MPRETGLPSADAADDFLRQRRRAALGKLRRLLRREPDDIDMLLSFDEVVSALGRTGDKKLGLQTISLASILGSTDRTRDFDKRMRPTSQRSRERWQRIDEAQRRGEAMPPIDVYRIGDIHFIKDGHHRVSVARALGAEVIEAYVTEVLTKVPASGISSRADLMKKDYERIFELRVPLSPEYAERIVVTRAESYAELAENVEAWGFRLMQNEGQYLDRETVARRWFEGEYAPAVEMLKEADLIGPGTEAEAYIRLAAERYHLVRSHEWSDDVIARLRGQRPRG